MKRKEPTYSRYPAYWGSSSLTSPHVVVYEGQTKKRKGYDYEVFLSFRGEDTRKGFTDYLYSSLINAGIQVFKDDITLRVGEEISQVLLYSITQSKISIPIISKNYVYSKWCLCELVKMLKCNRNDGQIVLPIFYKVEPSQLRHLTREWVDAIDAHKKNLDEMIVEEWKKALKDVSFLKGWESEKIHHGHDVALVKEVVIKVRRLLKKTSQLNVQKEFVGIDNHVEKIMSWIGTKFDDTRVIGIYGMGGIGKTALANVLYDELLSHFECFSFVTNIRVTSKDKGIAFLQQKLIHDILGCPCNVSNSHEGINVIKYRFANKRVLITLDDIDDFHHLHDFAVNGRWFKAGSIVIVTTRNEKILDCAGANYKYQLNELSLDQSLILFSRRAFGKDSLPSDYQVFSHDVISITGGLPLALEVIGSLLHGETKEVWEHTLNKLKEVPEMSVKEKLMISYKALDDKKQHIFLDIACFFIGVSIQSPTYMWDACGFHAEEGIRGLKLRSLIKIDKDGKLMMQNQLRDLGRDIVRLEDTKPQNRSRLWNFEDVIHVLDSKEGPSKVEALCLDQNVQGRSYTSEQFKKLMDLRFLQVKAANLIGDFQNLFPKLRWLQWEDCPSDFTTANFYMKKLVVLDLSWSEISNDLRGWGPLKMATELKVLNLSGHSLRRTPNLSCFKSLKILIFEDCENLEEIHPSIKDIKTLVSLIIIRCWRLKELPVGVGRMEELTELFISKCAIKEIPISTGCLMKLKILRVSCCEYLAQLPESMDSLGSLTQIDLSHSQIKKLPISVGSLALLTQINLSHSKIKELPECMDSLMSLAQLDLSHSCIEELPKSLSSLVSLTQLDLSHTKIEELPESIGSLEKLETLDASNCKLLDHIPSSIDRLTSLQRLLLKKCHKLSEIPDSIGKLTSLTELDLKDMTIAELPESISSLKELKTLDASCCKLLACIPKSIGYLASLSLLDLRCCRNLTQLPDSISCLVSLRCLSLQECHWLREIPHSIGELASLTELNLKHTAIAKLPESIGFLKELKTLNASNCTSLFSIPSSIGDLASLSLLDLRFCRNLAQLPDSIGLLVSLQRLLLKKCYSLREIPHSIRQLTSLSELDLRHTGIVELPESIGSLKELEILDASRCASLACIPNSISNLASLSLLDLSKCSELPQLPDSIGSLVSLKQLLLRQCYSLREIPRSIEMLTSLTELDLRSTAIVEIPKSIRHRQKLGMLNIRGIHITELSDAFRMLQIANS